MTEAAVALGLTVDAVRSRIKRGTMDHVRAGGRVYVLLGDEEARPGHDQDTHQGGDQGTTAPEDRTAELIATLREQLAEEREARRRADTIIAQLTRANEEQARTIRELEGPVGDTPSREPEPSEVVDQEQQGLAGLVVERAWKVSKAKGPPVVGQDSVLADSTLLTSIVPLPVEYERDPYMPRYVRDRRVPDHAVIIHEVPSQERQKRMRYSEDWPRWLRRWRANAYLWGILLTALSAVTDFADTPLLGILPLRLVVAIAFGVYVGMKEIHQSEWRIWHTVGVLAGILTALFSYSYVYSVHLYSRLPMVGFVWPIEWPGVLVDVLVNYVLGTWLVFISGVLLGRGVQQKAEQERWGAQNVADASAQQGQATGAWTARRTALLGFLGAIVAALMGGIATVLAAIFGGGN